MFTESIIKNSFLVIQNIQKAKQEKLNKLEGNRIKINDYIKIIKVNPYNFNRHINDHPGFKLSVKRCPYLTERDFFQGKTNLTFTRNYLNNSKSNKSLPKILNEIKPILSNKPKLPINFSRNKTSSSNSKGKNPNSFFQENCYSYIIKPENCGYLVRKCFDHRLNWKEINDFFFNIFNFKWQQNIVGIDYKNLSKGNGTQQIVNHYEFHFSISNKASLFQNLIKYAETKNENIFKYIPFTILFDCENGKYNDIINNFEKVFNNINQYIIKYDDISLFSQKKKDLKLYSNYFSLIDKLGIKTPIMIPSTHCENNNGNLWILKAPNLNRGRCIKVINSISLLKKDIKDFNEGIVKGYEKENEEEQNSEKTLYKSNIVVVQKYIEKPLLYFGRKFDIRIWVLLTHKMEVYMFNEGHLKVCSVNYNLNSKDNYSHLTNYSFQKTNINFSKFEFGNEVSFDDLQYNIDSNYPNSKINFKNDIMPKIKKIIKITFRSVKKKINPYNRNFTFEIFGFDFMLDEDFNPFLIEVNTNPGLEESSPLIKMLVPRMIDDAIRLTVDDIFPPIYSFDNTLNNNNNNNGNNKNNNNFNNNNNMNIINYTTLNNNKQNNKKECIYQSPFPVKGYLNNENLFKYICNCNKDCDDFYNLKMKFRKLKIKGYKFKHERK